MTTTITLTTALANALGLPRGRVEATARCLREARMLPDCDATASVEHAVVLLLGLMAAPTPADAPDCARLYRQLPLDRVTRGELTPDGCTEVLEIGEPSPLMSELREFGETFGAFAASLVEAFEPGAPVEPVEIQVGGGPGTAAGAIYLNILDQTEPLVVGVKFTLAPLGGGRLPDDAPRARLDSYATVPGAIFTVLHELFAGSPDGSRKPAEEPADPVSPLE